MEDIKINEMPSKELLEQFIAQIVLGAPSTVIFNIDTGVFDVRKSQTA